MRCRRSAAAALLIDYCFLLQFRQLFHFEAFFASQLSADIFLLSIFTLIFFASFFVISLIEPFAAFRV